GGFGTRRELVASCIAVAPFGQRRPSLTGPSGSPSICSSCVLPSAPCVVYALSAQPTAQYGHNEWTSLAPAMRNESSRFFARRRAKPSGLASGVSAVAPAPAA